MKEAIPQLRKYEEACHNLMLAFMEKYYDDKASCHWMGCQIGDVAVINDDFISMGDMVDAIRLNVTYDQLSEWMEYTIEKENNCSLRYYLKTLKK